MKDQSIFNFYEKRKWYTQYQERILQIIHDLFLLDSVKNNTGNHNINYNNSCALIEIFIENIHDSNYTILLLVHPDYCEFSCCGFDYSFPNSKNNLLNLYISETLKGNFVINDYYLNTVLMKSRLLWRENNLHKKSINHSLISYFIPNRFSRVVTKKFFNVGFIKQL